MPLLFGLEHVRNPVLLETGTWRGHIVNRALEARFKKIISIELVPEIFKANLPRFNEHIESGRVHLLHGNSAAVMPAAMKLTNGLPTTFWLDAHYHNHGEETANPLFDELDAIAAVPNEGHIIMIDDRRMFKTWGIDEVKLRARLLEIHPGCVLSHGRGVDPDDILIARVPNDDIDWFANVGKSRQLLDISKKETRDALSLARRGKRRRKRRGR